MIRPASGTPGRKRENEQFGTERRQAHGRDDRQARFDLAACLRKLGDAVWSTDPKRGLELFERMLHTAESLSSKEQVEIFKNLYLGAISQPLIALGRTAEARRALEEQARMDAADPSTAYADVLGEIGDRLLWPPLLAAEGKGAEARREVDEIVRALEKLRADHHNDLTLVYFQSQAYRELAAMSSGQERRAALLKSAAAWHSWPTTSYTRRVEQKDLAAANR